jgi:hypothetical protein
MSVRVTWARATPAMAQAANTKTAERMYFFIERRVMRMRRMREFNALNFNRIIYDE